jgi:hypothetical protein
MSERETTYTQSLLPELDETLSAIAGVRLSWSGSLPLGEIDRRVGRGGDAVTTPTRGEADGAESDSGSPAAGNAHGLVERRADRIQGRIGSESPKDGTVI